MMHITILGGSGRIGQILIQQALDKGRTVTALVRRSGSLESLIASSQGLLHEQIGDATHPDDIKKATQNSDAIIHAVSIPFFHTKPTHIYSRTTQCVIDAIQDSNIHYVVMSSNGTHHIRRSLPRGIRQFYEYFLGDVATDKELEEQLLRQSSLLWTIIKSPLLTSGTKRDTKIVDFSDYTPGVFDMISRQSVASVILERISKKNYIMKKIVPLVQ